MSTELKSIRVLEFDGKESSWEGWSEKFKARAKRKGYKGMLLGKVKIPTDSEMIEYPEGNCKLADEKAKLAIEEVTDSDSEYGF